MPPPASAITPRMTACSAKRRDSPAIIPRVPPSRLHNAPACQRNYPHNDRLLGQTARWSDNYPNNYPNSYPLAGAFEPGYCWGREIHKIYNFVFLSFWGPNNNPAQMPRLGGNCWGNCWGNCSTIAPLDRAGGDCGGYCAGRRGHSWVCGRARKTKIGRRGGERAGGQRVEKRSVRSAWGERTAPRRQRGEESNSPPRSGYFLFVQLPRHMSELILLIVYQANETIEYHIHLSPSPLQTSAIYSGLKYLYINNNTQRLKTHKTKYDSPMVHLNHGYSFTSLWAWTIPLYNAGILEPLRTSAPVTGAHCITGDATDPRLPRDESAATPPMERSGDWDQPSSIGTGT